jgi:hypothetical protein
MGPVCSSIGEATGRIAVARRYLPSVREHRQIVAHSANAVSAVKDTTRRRCASQFDALMISVAHRVLMASQISDDADPRSQG